MSEGLKQENPNKDTGAGFCQIKLHHENYWLTRPETQVQLTLKQQGFKLHRSTFSSIIFNSKCHRTTQPAVS